MDRQERKQIKHDEFVDTTFKVFQYLEDHPKPFLYGAIAIVLAVVGVFAARMLAHSWSESAAQKLSRGQAALEAQVTTSEAPRPNDPYRPVFASAEARAREAATRLEEAAKSGSSAGMIAKYLRGVALLQAGDAAGAVAHLEEAAQALGSDPSVGVAVRAALAEGYSAAGRGDKSIESWKALAGEGSGYPRDLALAGLGRALERAGKRDEAKSTFQQIVDSFPSSAAANTARAALARL